MDPNKSKVDERKGLVLPPSGRVEFPNTFDRVNTGCFATIIIFTVCKIKAMDLML